MPRISKTQDSDEFMAVYMKAVEDGDSVGQIIYGRLIAMTQYAVLTMRYKRKSHLK